MCPYLNPVLSVTRQALCKENFVGKWGSPFPIWKIWFSTSIPLAPSSLPSFHSLFLTSSLFHRAARDQANKKCFPVSLLERQWCAYHSASVLFPLTDPAGKKQGMNSVSRPQITRATGQVLTHTWTLVVNFPEPRFSVSVKGECK